MAMVNVMYVGNARSWPDDTALHTKRVWGEYGAVVEVPDYEAPHYTQHPAVWRAVSETEMVKLREQAQQVAEVLQEVDVKFAGLSSVQLKTIRAQLDAEIVKREQAEAAAPRVDEVAAKAAGAEPLTLDPSHPETAAAAAARMGKIMQAIGSMDKNDPTDWARTPKELPRVGRVTEICGFKVSQDEIVQAVELLKAA